MTDNRDAGATGESKDQDPGANPRAGETNRSEPGPVFIVGCGRSGTTVLRLMLNAHPDLAIPDESHFIYQMARKRGAGRWPKSLDRPADWERFTSFLKEHRFMLGWQIDHEALYRRLDQLSDRSHASVFAAMFEEFARQRGKPRWGDKTPMHVQYLLVLKRLFPNAQFVHIIRDGRDVVLSLLTRIWGPRHISVAGSYWKWLVLTGMITGAILGPDCYREVRFEELVMDPEAVLRSLCEWLGLEYTDQVKAYYATEEAKTYATQGEVAYRLAEPLDRRRVNLWKTEMSTAHHRSVMRQAGGLLDYLGYEIDHLPPRPERELETIRNLLQPESIARLDAQAGPRTGADPIVRLGVRLDHFLRVVDFGSGRLESWARASIRRQRTLAEMLS